MKVWLMKYCMTTGIIQIEVEHSIRMKGYVRSVKKDSAGVSEIYKLGRDVFEREEDALQAADALRNRKIASLEKQAEKLRNLKLLVVRT